MLISIGSNGIQIFYYEHPNPQRIWGHFALLCSQDKIQTPHCGPVGPCDLVLTSPPTSSHPSGSGHLKGRSYFSCQNRPPPGAWDRTAQDVMSSLWTQVSSDLLSPWPGMFFEYFGTVGPRPSFGPLLKHLFLGKNFSNSPTLNRSPHPIILHSLPSSHPA